jgi:hypothetical protein
MNHHEDLSRLHTVPASSERAFGLVFSAVSLLIGATPLLRGHSPRVAPLVVACAMAAAALAYPRLLHIPNVLWARFGRLLQRITNPLFLGLVFFGVLTPLALVLRVTGKGMLEQRPRSSRTYWQQPTSSRDMRHQF